MADVRELDRAFHLILETFVRTGSPPGHGELATGLGRGPGEGRRILHELMATRIMPMWLSPGTDAIASFAPFHATPTHYRVTVDGHPRWFAQ
jgi:hypothetical protein